jgi:phosphoribosylformylglycinamidine synthase subunit PurS
MTKFDIEVKISLKNGMLNPEATTIERSLQLLGYEVEDAKTIEIINFKMESDKREEVEENVIDMCERLLCNPVIHDYKIDIIPHKIQCGWTSNEVE